MQIKPYPDAGWWCDHCCTPIQNQEQCLHISLDDTSMILCMICVEKVHNLFEQHQREVEERVGKPSPHMDYKNPKKSGQIAFLQGDSRDSNPYPYRNSGKARWHWDDDWIRQSSIQCPGIELTDGSYSGCTQTNGDCPVCGL